MILPYKIGYTEVSWHSGSLKKLPSLRSVTQITPVGQHLTHLCCSWCFQSSSVQADILVITDMLDSMYSRETKDYKSSTEDKILPLFLLANILLTWNSRWNDDDDDDNNNMKWSFQENPPSVDRNPRIRELQSPVRAVALRASSWLHRQHSAAPHCTVSCSQWASTLGVIHWTQQN